MKKIIMIAALALFPNFVWAADAQMYKLDNGQTVVIQEVRNNPIVIIDTWIKTGSIDETDENNGVAHFLEHLFFKGTKNHEPGDFDRILETKGAVTNAGTSKDFTHYYITIPSKDFDMAIEINPYYTSAYFNRGIIKLKLGIYEKSIEDFGFTAFSPREGVSLQFCNIIIIWLQILLFQKFHI